MILRLEITLMSGVDDGLHFNHSTENGDGQLDDQRWTISIGRREDSDICLRHDIYVSRQHALIYWDGHRWWLQDCNSTNGTFIESRGADERVSGTIPINPGELFRVGRTWMRIEPTE